ncbi:MAG: hypothetical protein ACRYHA_18225 [Janthinobacterium lividum]
MRLPPLDLTLLTAHYLLSSSGAAQRHARPAGPPAWAPAAPSRAAVALGHAMRAGLPDFEEPQRSPARGARPPPLPSSLPPPPRGPLKPCHRNIQRAGEALDMAAATLSPSPFAETPASSPSASASPVWSDLSIRQRVEWALAIADADHQRIDLDSTLAAWERDLRVMTLQWLRQPAAPRSRTAPPHPLRTDWRTACRRHDATLALYWHVQREPSLDASSVRERARQLLRHAKAAPYSVADESFYQTNQLADRFDLDALRSRAPTPIELLRTVHAFLASAFPEHRASLLDEAALAIAARLRQRCMARSAGALRAGTSGAAFREAIRAEIGSLEIAAKWIPLGRPAGMSGEMSGEMSGGMPPGMAPGAPATTGAPAWFDGIAIRNASGADIATLVAEQSARRHDLRHAARNDVFDPAQAEQWLRKRLQDLGESARFPIGTPLQSIDTILLRLGTSHGIERASGDDVATVLADFNRLCVAWRTVPRHWIAPTLSAAIHFARASADPIALAGLAPAEAEAYLLDNFIRSLPGDVRQRQERDETPANVEPRAAVRGLEEVIGHAHAARAHRGAFGFDIETLIAWLDGRIEPTPALAQALPALSAGERARLNMLRGSLAMLGEWQPRYLPLTTKMTLDPPTLPGDPDPTRVPLRHRALAARARDGEIVPLALDHAPDARLVYLRDEQRLVPLIASNAAIWELNWEGHVIGTVDERRLGEAHPSLAVGTRAQPPAAAMPQGSVALREGITVKELRRWLDRHSAPPPGTPIVLSDVADFGDAAEQRTIHDALELAYQRSATLRMLLRRAPSRQDAQRVRFTVQTGERARYVRAEHRIVVPPARDLETVVILGPAGAALASPTAIWIHELIHATTLLFDPPQPLAREHRGPVVYLTYRVLHEMNRTGEERVAYATADAFDADSLPAHLARIRPRVLLENLLLDRQLARVNPVSARTLVLGTEVARRATVRAALLLEGAVRDALRRPPEQTSFVQRLLDRFRWDTLAAAPDRGARLRAIDEFVFHARDIYERNAWSGGFLDAWLRRDRDARRNGTGDADRDAPRHGRWTLHVLADAATEQDPVPCRVLARERRVELALGDTCVYLSPTGRRPYAMRRRVAGLLAQLAMPPDVPLDVLRPETERGALAYVEDKLLGLDALSEERRVAARLWPDAARRVPDAPTNVSASAAYCDATRARRAADDEDAYLALACPPLTGCIAPP